MSILRRRGMMSEEGELPIVVVPPFSIDLTPYACTQGDVNVVCEFTSLTETQWTTYFRVSLDIWPNYSSITALGGNQIGTQDFSQTIYNTKTFPSLFSGGKFRYVRDGSSGEFTHALLTKDQYKIIYERTLNATNKAKPANSFVLGNVQGVTYLLVIVRGEVIFEAGKRKIKT